jgi:hypothetical protein
LSPFEIVIKNPPSPEKLGYQNTEKPRRLKKQPARRILQSGELGEHQFAIRPLSAIAKMSLSQLSRRRNLDQTKKYLADLGICFDSQLKEIMLSGSNRKVLPRRG